MTDHSAYKDLLDGEMAVQIAGRLGWTDVRYPRGRAFLIGVPPESTNRESVPVPLWPTDLNAAWRLLDAIEAKIEIMTGLDGEMLISWWDRVWSGAFLPNPARAICTAWLEWFDYRMAHPELFTEEYETYMRISRENDRKAMRERAPANPLGSDDAQ